MTEELLAIIIPGRLLSNNIDRRGQIDLLFESKDNVVITIRNDDEFMNFKENINDYVFEKIENDIQYHLDIIITYLQKYFKRETSALNFNNYEPATAFSLYKILAKSGFIVMINSQYNIPIFLPSSENILNSQLDSLERLNTIIDPKISISALFDNKEENFDTFNDLVEFIKIKRGKIYE